MKMIIPIISKLVFMNLQKKVSYLFLTIVSFVFVISCGENNQSAEEFVDSLPQINPQKINSFQSVGDTIFFDHLGYKTIPVGEEFLLYDRGDQPMLLQLNPEGNLVKQVSSEGRGPGEVQDINSIMKLNDEGILLYDQRNKKAVLFNSQFEYVHEFLPEPFEGSSLLGVYPVAESEQYLIRHSSNDFIWDDSKEPKGFLSQYDAESGSYKKSIDLQDRMFARLVIDDQVRGGSEVAFSPRQLVSYTPGEEGLYTYWTGSSEIAQISASFDTLNTIPVELPSQKLTSEEWDSLKNRTTVRSGADHWNTLSDLLPGMKTPVEKMKIDPQNRFWLKLNYSGESELWGVMDEDGEFQKVVHLPKGSVLTHISENHLGVRLDDITFALYEPVD